MSRAATLKSAKASTNASTPKISEPKTSEPKKATSVAITAIPVKKTIRRSNKLKTEEVIGETRNETVIDETVIDETVIDETPATPVPSPTTPGGTKKSRQTPTRDTVLVVFDELIKMIEDEVQRLKDGPTKNKGSKFLRSVNKRIKALRSQTTRVTKQKTKIPRKGGNKNSGFEKPVRISKELAKFAGWPEDELRSRTDVTKYICDYIANNNIQNPSDRRQLFLDSKLQKLLGHNPKKSKKPFRYCDVQVGLKTQNHFPKTED
jgi:chromatin remodeling complex protein RSC6